MSDRDLIVYLPNHGFADGTPIYISWLDSYGYVADSDADSFKIARYQDGSNCLRYSETITEGYVRQYDDSAGTTTISGLDHLEGETVQVTSNGSLVGSYTVENGSITVPIDVYTYQVGLPYRMKVRTMRLAAPQQGNTLQTRIKRIHEITVRYIRSKGGKAGQEYGGKEYLSDLNATYSNSSQDATVLSKGGFDEDAYVVITSDEPYPFTVLSTVISFEVEERR